MEDIIVDQLAVDTAAIVSETDAAPQSSCDEDDGWLSSSRCQRQPFVNATGLTIHEATHDDSDSDDDDAEDEVEEEATTDLYCGNMDDEDEAWVYKNMRGGREELVQLRHFSSATSIHSQHKDNMTNVDEGTNDYDRVSKKFKEENDTNEEEIGQERESLNNSTNNDEEKQHPSTMMTPQKSQIKQALLLKPRTSDAILSCPRCFTTVCMDCQQHDRYANQFRAMFVMNIGVDWTKRITYDDTVGGLKLDNDTAATGQEMGGIRIQLENNVNDDDDNNNNVAPDVIAPEPTSMSTAATSLREGGGGGGGENNTTAQYYSVHCGYCQYEVAVLDMTEEVYYFYACIASA